MPKKKSKKRKQKKKKLDDVSAIYGMSIVVFIVAICLIAWFGIQYIAERGIEENWYSTNDKVEKKECKHRRLLDGICVKKKKEISTKINAIMIDNHMHASPQTGLARAQIVYEAPVEGNYTRFMALYTEDIDIKKVGPVRSARPYYLDWLEEYNNIIYMHVGGSPKALEIIKENGFFHMDEKYRSWYFYRSTDREAPHNTYTSSKLWNKAWDDYGEYNDDIEISSSTHWHFSENKLCAENCVHDISVSFLSPYFIINWNFNTTTLEYERSQSGKLHKDSDGTPVVANTIIIQHVHADIIDAIGRKDIETIGSGKIEVFKQGYLIQGTWKKEDKDSITQWYDVDGNIIELQPGKIWIEVVPQNAYVEFKILKPELVV